MNRYNRLRKLSQVPLLAAMDAHRFVDENGDNRLVANLSRQERRKLDAVSKKIALTYVGILRNLTVSGTGYPVDKLIRNFAAEYTNRYASSGLMTQPLSFNYFEAFCKIELIKNSFAPYAEPATEIDHLFSVPDFFDYITNADSPQFGLSSLMELSEGIIHNFTQSGVITDFTYLNAAGREFVVSGFSMIRHGRSLHWFILGGEVLTDEEWQERRISQSEIEIDISNVSSVKRRFLSDVIKESGNKLGGPLPLEGTNTAIRTVIVGETDLLISKHLARCYMTEHENSFSMICDDPQVFSDIQDSAEREKQISRMKERIDLASIMWSLAEGFFQLPSYFKFKLTVSKEVMKASGKSPPRAPRGGQGIGARFKYVSSIEVSDIQPSVMRTYSAPHFNVETDGYWRRLPRGSYGHDRTGNVIRGKTWVEAKGKWPERTDTPKTVFIKSTVAAAKIAISEYISAAERHDNFSEHNNQLCVLYVMRCLTMKDEVYKVGWTSNSAEQRARELSAATGVPVSFAVVEVWQHPDPSALEKGVHALLGPYRLNDAREFFSIEYPSLKAIIETEIARTRRF